MFSPEMLIIITATFVAAGFVKGAIGLGLPTVTLALLTLPLGLKPTLGILVIPLVVTNGWQALQGGYLKELLKRLWLFLLVAVITVYAGVQVLAAARSDVLVAILGVILIINSIISFTRFRIPPPRRNREQAWSAVCGGLGGIMFGMTGNFIVPGILFLQALNLKRDMMVQALGLTFCTISTALALSMTQRSMLTPDLMMVSAGALVPAFFGMWLGTRYRKSISEEQFRKIFYAGLLVVGCSLLFGAVRNLWVG
jgi:uncharacterized membrane protein YfcA